MAKVYFTNGEGLTGDFEIVGGPLDGKRTDYPPCGGAAAVCVRHKESGTLHVYRAKSDWPEKWVYEGPEAKSPV